MKKLICILVCLTALISCTSNKKIHFRECQFEDRGKQMYVLYDNEPYEGELWSDDEKSMSMTCKKGFVIFLSMFHENGGLAIDVVIKRDKDNEIRYYDEDGDNMEEVEFMSKYDGVFAAYKNIVNYELEPNTTKE